MNLSIIQKPIRRTPQVNTVREADNVPQQSLFRGDCFLQVSEHDANQSDKCEMNIN